MKSPKFFCSLIVSLILFCGVSLAQSNQLDVAAQANGGVATAINYGTYKGTSWYPWKAIDGDPQTGWSSNWSMPAWLMVQFDQVYEIGSIGIRWSSHKHDYYVESSVDGYSWSTILGPSASPNEEGESPLYEYFDITPVSAKFIRIQITSTSAPSSHIFQSSVQDIEVYTASPAIDVVDPYTAKIQVSGGDHHLVGLRLDGTVVAVGDYSYGQTDTSSWTDIKQICAGSSHTLGLKDNGTVVAVGSNSEGKCNVSSWNNIKQISANWMHSVGLKTDGTVEAVGYCGNGKCDVGSWTDIVQVSAGGNHTVGLKSDGTVVAVGGNILFDSCNVSSWKNIVQIATGANHTVGLKSDGTVVAVGNSNYGLGGVSSWTNIKQISAVGDFTVGLKTDGTVVAVGSNSHGQLNVSSWSGVEIIATGVRNTLGIKADGTVLVVGEDKYGQLDASSWDLTSSQPTVKWYQDFDGDGYGNPSISMQSASQPYGYILDNTDCDDSDPNIYPGAVEISYDGIDQDCDGSDYISATVPYLGDTVVSETTVSQTFWPAGNDMGKVGDVYIFTNTSLYLNGQINVWASAEAPYISDATLSSISISYDVNSLPKGTIVYIGYGVGLGDTFASMSTNGTFVKAYKTVLDSKIWYLDMDGDGYGNSNISISSTIDESPMFVTDDTDCDDSDDSVFPGATEIAGDGIDQDCDGEDLQSSSPEDIYVLSPANNETISYGSSGGKVTFSFSKITNAAKYVLKIDLYDILTNISIPIPVELIPPSTSSSPWGGGGTSTPGFSEQFVGMVYELSLDSVTWDILALYDIHWGVEAYDSSGSLIGVTVAEYVSAVKLLASDSIAMTNPMNGASFSKADSAPTFQWETYQGVSTYLVILAHVGSLGFDTVISEENLALNLFPMNDATWQTMPVGQWYWTVLGYDSAGGLYPSDFTIFDFQVSPN